LNKKLNRIMLITCYNKNDKTIFRLVSGDNYKSFEDHFVDLIDVFTKEWIYKKNKCLGRILKIDIRQIWEAKSRFVNFGGLKWCEDIDYNAKVKECNIHSLCCEYLENLVFKQTSLKYLQNLLEKKQVLQTEEEKPNDNI